MPKVKKIELSFACDEDWNKMTPVEMGRHCASCQKTVVDFTGKSDAKVIAFYANKDNEKTCGQFRNGQLEHINKNLMLPERKIKPSFFRPLLASALLSSAACTDHSTTRGEPAVQIETVDADEKGEHQKTTPEKSIDKTGKQTQKGQVFAPRKISHVNSLHSNDTLQQNIQEFETVVFAARLPDRKYEYEPPTAGVPIISYEKEEKRKNFISRKGKAPLHKRIGAKIRGAFSRNE